MSFLSKLGRRMSSKSLRNSLNAGVYTQVLVLAAAKQRGEHPWSDSNCPCRAALTLQARSRNDLSLFTNCNLLWGMCVSARERWLREQP